MSLNFVPQNLLPTGVSVKSNCPVVESKSLLGHHTIALDDKRVSTDTDRHNDHLLSLAWNILNDAT